MKGHQVVPIVLDETKPTIENLDALNKELYYVYVRLMYLTPKLQELTTGTGSLVTELLKDLTEELLLQIIWGVDEELGNRILRHSQGWVLQGESFPAFIELRQQNGNQRN